MKLALVGAGFLGSLFAEEVAKLFFAHEESLEMVIIDDDTIDARNPANHLYSPDEIGRQKAAALADRLAWYPNVAAEAVPARIDRDSPATLHLLDADIIVDAVDNLPTRHWLWELGRVQGYAVLHLGVSQQGTGAVEWTFGEYDTFSLSPIALADRSPESVAEGTRVEKLRPCDLVRFRGLGLNTTLAGAKAVGIVCGMDPTEAAPPPERGTLTTWVSTNVGHQLIEVHRVRS